MIAEDLNQKGMKVASINIDGWLNLPNKRFNQANPAGHFYEHAIRFDEMFSQLILPLKQKRNVSIVAEFAEETATEYRRHKYQFEDVDIILLEGIYLLKRSYRHFYDLSLWIECTFVTALERALKRGQEGLPPGETIRAYNTIYFPAQRIHLDRDDPRRVADLIIINDPRIEGN
jgi:uridine kinase